MEMKRTNPTFHEVNHVVSPEDTEIQKHNWGIINLLSEKCVSPIYFRLSAAFIYPGMSQPEHEHPGEDELLYILSGKGKYFIGSSSYQLSAKNLVYIPSGVMHYTKNDGWEPLRYLSIKVPQSKHLEEQDQGMRDSQVKYVIPSEEIPVSNFKWGSQKEVNNWDESPLHMKMDIFYLLPHKSQQLYRHQDEVELIYVLSGKGAYIINGEQHEIWDGVLMHIPAGEEHYAVNTGWEPLKLITVKVPMG